MLLTTGIACSHRLTMMSLSHFCPFQVVFGVAFKIERVFVFLLLYSLLSLPLSFSALAVCPKDGYEWPETQDGVTIRRGCSLKDGYTGSRNRTCANGQWGPIIDGCVVCTVLVRFAAACVLLSVCVFRCQYVRFAVSMCFNCQYVWFDDILVFCRCRLFYLHTSMCRFHPCAVHVVPFLCSSVCYSLTYVLFCLHPPWYYACAQSHVCA